MFGQPRLHNGMFVRSVVITDQTRHLVLGRISVDLAQELQPFGMAVARLALRDDLAIQHIESGEQRGRAAALVVVCHGGRAPLLRHQPGLGAVQRMRLAFLVATQHQRVLRWRQEIARREDRLAAQDEAKRKLEARARERRAAEQADYEDKVARRQAKREAGQKPGGKDPQPPTSSGPPEKDQINLTDEPSRIMKTAGGGFDQCYNAQAGVDTDSMLIVAALVTQTCNDKQQVTAMLERLKAHEEAGLPTQLLEK